MSSAKLLFWLVSTQTLFVLGFHSTANTSRRVAIAVDIAAYLAAQARIAFDEQADAVGRLRRRGVGHALDR